MAKEQPSYQELREELDAILLKIQSGEFDIDMATKEFARARQIVLKLEDQLKKAENHVSKIKIDSI